VAKYGNVTYGGTTYGETRKLAYSVEPLEIVVLSFSTAYVTWYSPTGAFSRIRLVRNQIGFAETAEDGIIIWEENATEGTVTRSAFTDGVDNPTSVGILAGKHIYYSMFLFTEDKVWINAGTAFDIVPTNQGAQKKIMDILPRVYTSAIQSPLGVVDETTALYSFIDGMSFTYEQLLTELELLRPSQTSNTASHLLLPVETSSLGLNQEPNIPIKNQNRLVREAFKLYGTRGQKIGIENYIESLSGYAPTVTLSTNLLLSVQDSTFYNSVGNWAFTNATAATSTEQVPATGTTVIDTVYTCKVIASGLLTMSLGLTTPIKKAVPVKEQLEYTASVQVKSPASAGNITIGVVWHDKNGTVISTSTGSSVSANNTWKSAKVTATSPVGSVYAALKILSSASGTYYFDQVCMQLGSVIAYDEARAIDILLLPNKINYVKNPSFEVNVTDNWTITGSATAAQNADVSSIAYSGVKSAKITASGSWTFTSNSFPVSAGTYKVVSAFVKTTSNLTMTLIGRNAGGTIVDSADVYAFGTVASWSRVTGTVLVDAFDTGIATYEIKFSGGSGVFYLDSVQAEDGVTPSEYFDGSVPSQFGAIWSGVANNSYSHLYYSKPFKVPRIGYTVDEWVPPNAFWRVRTAAAIEYTNLTV